MWSLISLIALPWTWYLSAPIGLGLLGASLLFFFKVRIDDGLSFVFCSVIISMTTWACLVLISDNDAAMWVMVPLTMLFSVWTTIRSRSSIALPRTVPKLTVKRAALLVLGIMIVYLAWSAYQPYDGDELTELYVLNLDGEASDYPEYIGTNEVTGVLLGLNNHEGRQVTYHIQVWLTDRPDPSDILNVTMMVYIDDIVVTLDDQEYPEMGEWEVQYLERYDFSIPWQGSYKLWFVLFIDDVPSEYQGLTSWSDHLSSGSISLLQDVQDGEDMALSLNLVVLP